MDLEKEIWEVLQKYFRFQQEIDEAQLNSISIENEVRTEHRHELREQLKRNMELHIEAEKFLEEEVLEYRKNLHKLSKTVANSELEKDVITKSHMWKAKELIWRRKTRFTPYDGFLAAGSLCIGLCVPNLIGSFNGVNHLNHALLVVGIIGGILFGIGATGKAHS